MYDTALFRVVVGGRDVSSRFAPILERLRVVLAAGESGHNCEIVLADENGRVLMPQKSEPIAIELGWQGTGVAPVFFGKVSDVRSSGARGQGRLLTISGEAIDNESAVKAEAEKHEDDATLGDVARKWGSAVGLQVEVAASLAQIRRPYWAMTAESFLHWGTRTAREVGGTFVVAGTRAAIVPRNGAESASGAALGAVGAVWGKNLLRWDIAPVLGRPKHEQVRVRWYDPKEAKWKEQTATVSGEGLGEAKSTFRFTAPDEGEAKDRAGSEAAELERAAGEGTVTVLGEPGAMPEATCRVAGARPGIDGAYRIETVTHELSRQGFTTELALKRPGGAAGTDDRG